MSRATSPLRDRVIFIDGAARSGTTWLVTLLATHPQIAGVDRESHLFDEGVDALFDNFDVRNGRVGGLRVFVDREQLVELARDLCDGVLLAMRAKVSPDADFVVEKTPTGVRSDGIDLALKRECYPDARYLHIVRDREAVIRSLQNAPWQSDRSYEACAAYWDDTVGSIRTALSGAERYREVRYEDLRDDPAEECRKLFDWLGVDSSAPVLETVRALSKEQFSELGAVTAASSGSVKQRLKAHVKDRIERLLPDGSPEGPDPVAFGFSSALRADDADALRSLTRPDLELVVRRPEGDVHLRGEQARDALCDIAHDTFGRRRFVGQWWATSGCGPGEWWTTSPDKPVCTMLFSGIAGEATRVDLAIGLMVQDDLVRRVVLMTPGPFSGRPVASSDVLEDG